MEAWERLPSSCDGRSLRGLEASRRPFDVDDVLNLRFLRCSGRAIGPAAWVLALFDPVERSFRRLHRSQIHASRVWLANECKDLQVVICDSSRFAIAGIRIDRGFMTCLSLEVLSISTNSHRKG